MEQSLDDLFSGAFSELSVPPLEDEDFDFENLNSDDKLEEYNSHENLPTKEDGALHQEAACETTVLFNVAKNVDEEQTDDKNEDFQGAGCVGISVISGIMSMDKTPQEDITSSDSQSEEESSDTGEGEEDSGTEEKPGDLLMSVHGSGEVYYDNKEDKVCAKGQTLALEGTENPLAGNQEQGEIESDEEVSYFGTVPEHGNEMIVKGDGTEVDEREREEKTQEDSSDSECERIKQEENVLAPAQQEVKSPYKMEASSQFLEMSEQNLQDLIADVDAEQCAEKMRDFSGDEHQEAGESFADYPSDFSSCEYVEGGGQNHKSDFKSNPEPFLEKAVPDITLMGEEADSDEEGDRYLYSRDLEMDADRLISLDRASEENGKTKIEIIEYGFDAEGQAAESDSYSSSDDDVQASREDELSGKTCLQDLENYKKDEDTWLHNESDAAFARSSTSDDHTANQVADFHINWDFDFQLRTDTFLHEDLLTTEDGNTVETLSLDVTQRPAEDDNSYSVVQREDRKTASNSYQGCLDDSFFFNTDLEASEVSELGQLGHDEYEEERNWEQEQERIKAFYKFYDDSEEENGREERPIKVQFCADPLSQVIHYETESSDRDSLSSSTEGEEEEDLSSAETSEDPREPDIVLERKPAYDPLNVDGEEFQLSRSCLKRSPVATEQTFWDSPNIERPQSAQENDLRNIQICSRGHKSLRILKQIVKMCLVIVMGPLVFWLATDQADWLSQISFF